MHLILESDVVQDNYTNYICDKYDLQNREKRITIIPIPNMEEINSFEWNIGIILGSSGSGKSTILKHLGDVIIPSYDNSKSIISQFPHLSEQDVTILFAQMGLSSVPTWLSKPNELSNGEKARLDMCWQIAMAKENDIILIDEFTSVVNRSVAQSMAYSVNQFARDKNLKIILSSCHYDILDSLNPDWIFNLNKMVNEEVELERCIYTDNKDYALYSQVNPNETLTRKHLLPQ